MLVLVIKMKETNNFISFKIVVLLITVLYCYLCHGYVYKEDHQLSKMKSDINARIFIKECTKPDTKIGKNSSEPITFTPTRVPNPLIFAIFTTGVFSIILPDVNETNYYNITLGINKNRRAEISKTNSAPVSNENVPDLPTTPYLIKILTDNSTVSVYDLQSGSETPFLTVNKDPFDVSRIKITHEKEIEVYTDCCDKNCRKKVFHRISGCKRYQTSKASRVMEKFDLTTYNEPMKNGHLFNSNFIIDYPENSSLAAKIRFTTSSNTRNGYLIVLTDRTASIFHFYKNESRNQSIALNNAYVPMSINITITKHGVVHLTETHLEQPYLTYKPKSDAITNVLYMSMSKLTGDSLPYNFYHECNHVWTYTDKKTDNITETDIITTPYGRNGSALFDYLHIFTESFDLIDRNKKEILEETGDFDSADTADDAVGDGAKNVSQTKQDNMSNKFDLASIAKSIGATVLSAFFVGFLKLICSFDCVKNAMMNLDRDEDEVKSYRRDISNTLAKNIVQRIEIAEDATNN